MNYKLKIPKTLIMRFADNIIIKEGKTSQIDVQTAIEQALNRSLNSYEKSRITHVLRWRYVLTHIRIDSRTKRRILEFK